MQNTRTCRTIFGHRMTVFEHDNIGAKIVKQGLFEKDTLEFLLDLLRLMDDPVVLDIGANIGNHALAFSTVAAHVHAFEPIPKIYAVLQENVRQNDIANISVHTVALSDKDGDAVIHMVNKDNLGASSFDKRTDDSEAMTVRQCKGDTLLATLGITRVDLLKIDVEAHEEFVLRGLMHTLQQQRPVITMEWNDPLTVRRFVHSPVMRFLNEHYHILVLGCNHDKKWWQGRPLAWPRRKFTRHFLPRRAVIYPFHPELLYDNLLLIPLGREDLLAPLLNQYAHSTAP